ncbi:MAG: endonuclease/exonuclease/phosphatase family protein, partial [Bacteroides sp.]|nr:endonuclease/exonuclease/phosphatase family protein [Bacteroides sp.]
HWGKMARTESGKLILSKIKNFCENIPVFISGDFNVDQSSECYEFLNTSELLFDSYNVAEFRHLPTGTFNKWKINGYSTSRIDHIFVSGDVTVDKYGIFTDTYLTPDLHMQDSLGMDGMYVKFLDCTQRLPSDHYPIRITVEL